jgi:hypothetical protein
VLLENEECDRYRGVGEMNVEFDAGGGHFDHL